MASFASLPPELIQRIAFLALISPNSSPLLLLSLFQLSPYFYRALNSAHNHALYASLFKALFDFVPIIRRLAPIHSPLRILYHVPASHLIFPSSSLDFLFQSPPNSPLRPSSPSPPSPNASGPEPDYDLLDSHFSAEFVERMALFRRMRAFAALPSPSDAPPGQTPPSVDLRDLWLIYLMVMESDGRNMEALVERAAAPRFMRNFFLYFLCSSEMDALVDFPQATPEIAIGLKLCHLFLDLPLPLLEPLRVTIDSRLGFLKPYNFACHRYDLAYAPWILRDLPLASCASPARLPAKMRPNEREMLARLHLPDAAVTTGHAYELSYMGRRLTLLAPLVSHVASANFFWATCHPYKWSPDDPEQPDPLTTLMRRPLSLRSIDYDLEFARALACTDPFRAPGLAFDAFEGCFGGQWIGKFGFMEFGSCMELLGGNIESLFRGRYGAQPQSFQLVECLVRLRDARTIRFAAGTRPWVNRGRREPRLVHVVNEARYLLGLPTPDEKDLAVPEEVLFEPGERYELQIHGSGHSRWGAFSIKGRVREWDGLVTFIKVYRDPDHGRWLYRGYYTAGDMIVGRWKAVWRNEIGEDDDEGTKEESDEEDSSPNEASEPFELPQDETYEGTFIMCRSQKSDGFA